MAVFCPLDDTCDHCGKKFPENGLMVNKFQVYQYGTWLSFCPKCFPQLYPGVQVPDGWKRHFNSVGLLENSPGTTTV